MNFHEDALVTEEIISRYLLRSLDEQTTELFESHYLECDLCFNDLRAAELLMSGLNRRAVKRKTIGDVAVFEVDARRSLGRRSPELLELSHMVMEQKEAKVLIDLSKVSRIDSAGLGVLMECYRHAIGKCGTLKLLNPSAEVQRALSVTKIDSVIETYFDENEALGAFGTS
jgi:anti-sigma B factor antagonist